MDVTCHDSLVNDESIMRISTADRYLSAARTFADAPASISVQSRYCMTGSLDKV
jgi:hypothetical protein